MAITLHGNLKLSVPETAGRSIHIWDSENYQEEPRQSVTLHDGGLRTFTSEPTKPCSAENCSEEPPQSVKLHDDGLRTCTSEPTKPCSAGPEVEVLLCPKEMPPSVTSSDFGPQIKKSKSEAVIKIRSPITNCTDHIDEIYLRVKLIKALSKLYLDYNSQYYNPPRKQPTRSLVILSLHSVLHKLDAFYRELFSASWLMLKVMLISLVPSVASETHSLRYYHTGVLQQDDSPYKFEAAGFVDYQQIDQYDQDTKLNSPVAPWMENYEDKNYWDRETNYRRGWEKVFNDNLRILSRRLNDSCTFLTLQLMYGCERNENGNVTVHYQYAVNGRDFLHFDDKSLLWISAMYEAHISADRWNTDPIIAKSVKHYLTQQCTKALERYISLGEQELTKRVRPEVKVWGRRQSDGATRLQCLVYGFHPRAVDVKWMKNEVDLVPSYEMTPILPHPDGTYQVRVGVEVPTSEEDAYSCHVEHSSLGNETVAVKWEPTKYNPGLYVVLLTIPLIIMVTIFLIKLFKAKSTSRFYSTASTVSSNE